MLDDTTLDKPYAKRMELVSRHWSGKHKRVVWGINLLTLLWTDGNALIPCDFRVYDRPLSGLTKNDHFRRMLEVAEGRGFQPRWVLFDSWYTSLENLKAIRDKGWFWMSQLRSNRRVNPEGAGNLPLATVAIPQEGRQVHQRGYGFIRVFRTVSKDGDVEHWATNDLEMMEQQRESLARQAWGIETYHRGLKQCCGVEKCQVRTAEGQWNHICLSLQAFLRLEAHRLSAGVSWYESKANIIRSPYEITWLIPSTLSNQLRNSYVYPITFVHPSVPLCLHRVLVPWVYAENPLGVADVENRHRYTTSIGDISSSGICWSLCSLHRQLCSTAAMSLS